MVDIIILASIPVMISLLITPVFIRFSVKYNITDKPKQRKVHQNPIPTMGGIVIFLSFILGVLILRPSSEFHLSIMIGAILIVILGVFDDKYDLSPKIKLLVQVVAASTVVFLGGLQIGHFNLPFGGQVEFDLLSPIITIIWIVGITNAINLIDGLDGLAAGVSSIALLTITVMAIVRGDVYVVGMASLLLFSTLGFLKYNFYPAKIFMGDTGALLLGYMISILSLFGFKNVTFVSYIIPILILGVPIADTFLAIIRRYINKQPISKPDKSHLHHRLIVCGFSHKQTVIVIYILSAMFSLTAIFFTMTTIWGMLLISLVTLLTLQILIENLEMIRSDYKPLTKILNAIRHKG